MTHKNSSKTAILVLILCLAAAGSAAAAGGPSIDSSLITWDGVPGQKLTLTVAGGGQDYRYELGAGEAASFSIFDQAGQLLPDGNYTWQITAAPALTKDEMQVLAEARNAGVSVGAKAVGGFTESGYFTVFGGAFVTPAAVETSANKDQVFADDLIVQGSACVGMDCVNNENFGFDTIRIKENNTRIKFDDTSTGSFPSVDWQLTANDSNNGGANKFSIDDVTNAKVPFTIEANAPNNTLYVASEGRIGVNTATPAVEAHVADGDSPTLRLEQNGSAGFTAQTWDVAGNEANFFVRDVTNGSKLPFRIKPGAGDNSIFIAADGDVGMGVTDGGPGTLDSGANASLHVRRTDGEASILVEEASSTVDNGRFLLELRNNGNANFTMQDTNANNAWDFSAAGAFRINKQGSGASEFTLFSGGNLTISGELTTSGSCSMGCDRVFSDDYELESIEEHAEHMWQNSYLEGVGPTLEGKPFNMSQKTQGMLNELEKAHIYIEQLNDELKDKEQRIARLEAALARIEARDAAAAE
jgi:hypothetical protein